MSRIRLRGVWFQFHKWIGLLLAVAIVPISLTGAVLVWDTGVERIIHPARHASDAGPQRPLDRFVAAARGALKPGEVLMRLDIPDAPGEPVVATAARAGQAGPGRPVRTMIYLDPRDAHLIDRTRSDAGLIRLFHVIHGSLMVPGVGRQVVGWIGVAMLISCLSGIWLWWPTMGGWLRGLRWRRSNRTDDNLHHLLGFWVAVPLAVLSFTGVWISFPQLFAMFEPVRQARPAGPPPAFRAIPVASPKLDVNQVVALAGAVRPGGVRSVEWPTDMGGWRIGLAQEGRQSSVLVDDLTAEVKPEAVRDRAPETTARFMRRLHDGTRMPLVWRLIITAGGIIPAMLAITGIIMWLRTRGWRGRVAKRRRAARAKKKAAAA